MDKKEKTKEELLAEVDELKLRLLESEETLNAIQSGEVDALVVDTHDGMQTFTLKGADYIYRVLIEQMNQGVAILAADFTISYCNNQMALMSQVPLEMMVGRKITDFIPEDELSKYQPLSKKSMEILKEETILKAQDGTKLPIELSIKFLDDANSIYVIITDLSYFKRAEEAIRAQAEMLSQVNDAVIAVDNDEKVTYWNKGAERLYEVKSDEILGKPLSYSHRYEWITPEDETEAFKLLETKGYWRGENIHIKKNGEKIHVDALTTMIKDDKGIPVGMLAIIRDITEYKRSEEALKESEIKYRELFDKSTDMISLSEINENGMPGKYIEVNEVGLKRLGYTKEEMLNMSPTDIIAPDKRVEMPKNAVEMAKKGFSHFEIVHVTKEGKIIPVDIYGHIIKYQGRKVYLTVSRDITERKKADEKLQETITELKRSNNELQSFAYITSHDLQEPLRTMGNYAGLLKRRYEGRLDKDADDFLDYMASGAARMKDMVQGLLDYSRVGTQGGEFREFSVEEALDDALINLKSAIEECHTEINHDPLPEIVGDESQITRVFQNLIGNALKFRKKGVPPKIHISARNENGEYVFSVQDNGIGIEEEYTDRIFEVFKRLHAIGEYHGVGIGLAVVKRIIDRHGGRVWVESEFGVGSNFYFTIPIVNEV